MATYVGRALARKHVFFVAINDDLRRTCFSAL